jgi:hypothetical protein
VTTVPEPTEEEKARHMRVREAGGYTHYEVLQVANDTTVAWSTSVAVNAPLDQHLDAIRMQRAWARSHVLYLRTHEDTDDG